MTLSTALFLFTINLHAYSTVICSIIAHMFMSISYQNFFFFGFPYISLVVYLLLCICFIDYYSILDNMWYRVICDDVKPGKLVKVHSVDLGIVAYLSTGNMKKLPIELTFHPIHVYECILGNYLSFMLHKCNKYIVFFFFLDCSNVDIEKLKLLKEYENTDFEFTIVKNLGHRNCYLINCPLLENILQ